MAKVVLLAELSAWRKRTPQEAISWLRREIIRQIQDIKSYTAGPTDYPERMEQLRSDLLLLRLRQSELRSRP